MSGVGFGLLEMCLIFEGCFLGREKGGVRVGVLTYDDWIEALFFFLPFCDFWIS